MNEPAHILVVDDTPHNVTLLTDLLGVKGYAVRSAANGEEALACIATDCPDLVLLDVVMPGLSGYDVCRAIRADPTTGILPVVMVTALDPTTERIKGLEAGADDFLTKPINQAELLARVRSLLRIKSLYDTVQEQAEQLAVWNTELERRVAEQVEQLGRLSRLEHELSLASEIQKSMLPRSIPLLEGYEFSAHMIPAKSVGGDFYDFIPLGEGLLGIAIGDVSDKGIPAALFMAMVRSLLRAEAHPARSLQKVLRSVNHHLMDMNENEMFVTILFGILNCATHQFQYVRAGHEAPIIFDAQGSFKRLLKTNGQALGVFEVITLDQQTVELSKGSMLVLCSDGIPEAPNRQNISFGYDGIAHSVRRMPGASAQAVCDELIRAVVEHQAGSLQQDDMTVVILRAV
jgi:sigma-B regulation protein RsbU (phosphoserine phosphatase)